MNIDLIVWWVDSRTLVFRLSVDLTQRFWNVG